MKVDPGTTRTVGCNDIYLYSELNSELKLPIGLQSSGVATGVARGQSATPDSEKFAKNREKEGKIGKKSGKSG